jgi:cytochrome c oxidase cbb3-type subunit 3/ubiquinol-cytochrome c reductase cytochrome c subunit
MTTIFVIMLSGCNGGAAVAQVENLRDQDAEAKVTSQLARGVDLYGKHCALCHGARGEGYAADKATALANQDFLVSVNDEFLRRGIANGRPGTPMAAHAARYGGPLDDADIDAVVALIRSWQREPTIDIGFASGVGDPDAGRGVFGASCAACHGDRGQGGTAVSLNNPEFLASASDGLIRRAITHGRRGTPMRAFESMFSEETIDGLVALIRSWQQDAPALPEARDLPEVETIILNPDGSSAEFSLREDRYVSAEQLDAAMRNRYRLIVLDARPTSDWLSGHIPGAVSAPHYDPESIIARLPRDGTWIVSYCACPHRYSGELTDALREAGFRNTAVLDEGVQWWEQQGYPIER